MDIAQHVPSLETCKRMKELGWSKDTYFWYSDWDGEEDSILLCNSDMHSRTGTKYTNWQAPLLSEILEELPQEIVWQDRDMFLEFEKDSHYVVKYAYYGGSEDYFEVIDPPYVLNPIAAEAAALLWVKLREENIIPSHE